MAREGAILVLKTGEALAPVKARFGDFDGWVARGLGRTPDELVVANVYAGDALPDPASIGGVVVTGSPAMVTDRADWSEASAAWLGKLVEGDRLPVLGVCYGHQLIAHALGGEVGENPNGREMGTVEVRLETSVVHDDALLEPGAHPGHMSHVESVLQRPRDAEVLATTDLEPHAALRFGPRQWGVQFHPEFDGEIMRGYFEARREVLASEGFDVDAMIGRTEETHVLTRVLARFAVLVEEGGA